MRKNWLKALGASAIIIVLFLSILFFTNQEVPAKSNDEEEKPSVEFEENEKIHEVKETKGHDNVLMTAFDASDGQLEGTNISIWSQIKDGDYTLEEMEEISLECASILDLEKDAEIDITEDGDYNKIMVTNQKDEDIYITIVMENFKKEGLSIESYLLIDLYLSNHYKDICQVEEIILDYFTKQGFEYQYAMTIYGTFSNKLNTDIMREVIGKTFESIEGQIIEGMEETEYGQMVSLTGYSPKLENNIQLAGDQINLNAAMRYSEHDDKTYIWIGTPLIATEY
jgi:hypothetical protein